MDKCDLRGCRSVAKNETCEGPAKLAGPTPSLQPGYGELYPPFRLAVPITTFIEAEGMS